MKKKHVLTVFALGALLAGGLAAGLANQRAERVEATTSYSGTIGIECQLIGDFRWDDANAKFAIYFRGTKAGYMYNEWSELVTLGGNANHLYLIPYELSYDPIEGEAVMDIYRFDPSADLSNLSAATANLNSEVWNKALDVDFGNKVYLYASAAASSVDYWIGADSNGWAHTWDYTLNNAKFQGGKLQFYGDISLSATDEFKLYVGATARGYYDKHSSLNDVLGGGDGSNITCNKADVYSMYHCEGEYDNNEYVYVTTRDLARADEYAQAFLLATSVCDEDGKVNNITNGIWIAQDEAFDALPSDTCRGYLTNAANKEDGSFLEQAAARYDYIVGKYSRDDFMGRKTAGTYHYDGSFVNPTIRIENGSTIALVVVISSMVITALGAIIILKKRKEN